MSFLRGILGSKATLDEITAPMTKIVNRLVEYSNRHEAAADADDLKAVDKMIIAKENSDALKIQSDDLRQSATDLRQRAAAAKDLVAKYRNLIA